MRYYKYFYLFFCIGSVLYGIYLFSLHLLLGDLLFHTDIARDFLLIQDIAINHKLTLIGPRAGGIPGTFFGPIWLYLNLPAFIIGNGNPLFVGYFWLLLFIFGVAVVFYISQKVFNTAVGLIAMTIYIYTVLFLAAGFTQSFTPMLISPILLYIVYLYIEKKKIIYLCLSVLLCGITVQLQPAFGIIIVFVTFILSLFFILKRKKIMYLLTWLLLIFPLATYIVFESRHNFIETQALANFFFHHDAQIQFSLDGLLKNRLSGFLDAINLININVWYVNLFFLIINVFTFYKWFITKKSGKRTFIILTYYYFIGFWITTFFFKGFVWDYYYWGLYPLLAISLASLFLQIDKRIFLILYVIIILCMMRNGYNTVQGWKNNIYGKDNASWIVNKSIAEYVYQNANDNFGYYIYSPNEYGYSKKYAMDYIGRSDAHGVTGTLCKKEKVTFLIFNPVGTAKFTDPVYWKNKKVSITSKPVSTRVINNVRIEKYILNPAQIAVPSDPNIICDLTLR